MYICTYAGGRHSDVGMKETGIKKNKQTHKDSKKSSSDNDCTPMSTNDTMTTNVSCDTVLNYHDNSSDAVSDVTQLQITNKKTKKLRKRSLPLMNTSNSVLLLEHDNNNTKKRKSLSSTNEFTDGSVTKVTHYIIYHLVSTNIWQYQAMYYYILRIILVNTYIFLSKIVCHLTLLIK